MSDASTRMEGLVDLVHGAGREILKWYGRGGRVEEKEDCTPLTDADRASHVHLIEGLSRLTPKIPVISEESPSSEIKGGREWERYWLVDPLDGTKEFLKGTGEFTVNVALIEAGRPVIGIVHVPVLGDTYRASLEHGSEKAASDGRFASIQSRPFETDEPVLVGSRDHAGPAVERLAHLLGSHVQFTSMGSSLKFCLVAEGRADLYLRDRPTMEWDTAAAQCIVECAGGGVFALDESTVGTVLRYNKPTLLNPHFLCVGDLDGPWRELSRQARPAEQGL